MAQRNQVRSTYYPLGGGLDVVTPALTVDPGRALAMVNYEPYFNGGYRRVDGYERFDGRPRPHQQTFLGATLVDATGLVVGTTLTGDTSAATGKVVAISGNTVAMAKETGTFTADEALNAAAYTLVGSPVQGQAADAATIATFQLAAEDDYRTDIAVVPGANQVRGAWRRDGFTYAVRDNVGETAGVLHLASAAGWTTAGVTMATYIFFDVGGGGTSRELPVEGDTVTGGTSGATATVHRIITHAGSTGTDDAEGYIVLTGISGTFVDTEDLEESATKFAEAASGPIAFAFSVGGKYRFRNHNFFGGSGTYRTYGVNGIDPGFEIDENNVVSPILFPQTALGDQPANNMPFLIEEHRNHLFMAFPGGSLQQTLIGEPLVFNGFLGAATFGLGNEITGLNSVVGGVLVVTTARETRGLFGADISDWELRLIGEQTGGVLNSTQKIDTVYGLDDLGITSIARTDAFGDFAGSTVSQLVQPIVEQQRPNVTDSTIVRQTNQYRVYFTDGNVLIMYVPAVGATNRERGSTETRVGVQFGLAAYRTPVESMYNTEDETGTERSFFTSTDGFVYEDRVGRNYDGETIDSYLRLAFNQIGTPSMRKFFRRADIELIATNAVELLFTSDLSYGSIDISSGLTALTSSDVEEIDIFGGGGAWDVSNWDAFSWDAQDISTARAELTGTGENIGFAMYNSSATVEPFVLQGINLHYDLRRRQR